MREIKFEFVLKDECVGNVVFAKLRYSLDEIVKDGISIDYIIEKVVENYPAANGVEANFELIAKRQYTGRKDKNGIEIYKGDIVKDTNNNIYEIIWRKKKARYAYLCQQGSRTNMSPTDVEDGIEIIGNKHENPELLEIK